MNSNNCSSELVELQFKTLFGNWYQLNCDIVSSNCSDCLCFLRQAYLSQGGLVYGPDSAAAAAESCLGTEVQINSHCVIVLSSVRNRFVVVGVSGRNTATNSKKLHFCSICQKSTKLKTTCRIQKPGLQAQTRLWYEHLSCHRYTYVDQHKKLYSNIAAELLTSDR